MARSRRDDRDLLPFEERPDGSAGDASLSGNRASSSRLRIARGPSAVEGLLRADVLSHVEMVRADPSRLARTIHVVVPSRTLRDHLQRAIATWCGGAAAGFEVTTWNTLATRLSLRAQLAPVRGHLWFPLAVELGVADVPRLARELERFQDGARVVVGTAADLFDAGFEIEHASALEEALRDARAVLSTGEIERATSIVAAAARASDHIASRGFARASQRQRELARALRGPLGETLGPVWIHGFADATGSGAELLESLLRLPDSRAYWDACADAAFGAALRERFGVTDELVRASSGTAHTSSAVIPSTAVTLSAAVSLDAEVRGAAERIRAALDAGARAESIGVVARDLTGYRSAIARHFGRLGIPFTAPGTPSLDGAEERRARALGVLLERRGEASIDRWFDARDSRDDPIGSVSETERRIAMRALGLATLQELANFDLDERLGTRDVLPLPVRAVRLREDAGSERDATDGDFERDGDTDESEEEDAGEPEAETASRAAPLVPRRTVTRTALAEEVAAARALVASFDAWPSADTCAAHARRASTWLETRLGWTPTAVGRAHVDTALESLRSDVGDDARLSAEEFFQLLVTALESSARRRFGGQGLGVACLSVVEARALTFETLHVLGLARGRFPRTVREDPMLSDAARSVLRSVLPDLPRKSVGRDEERVLFDQLVRAAPRVHLSWPTLDADGKTLLSSPLLERVVSPSEIAGAPVLSDVVAAELDADAPSIPRPAFEHAVRVGLRRGADGLDHVLPIAVRDVRALAGMTTEGATRVADARLAVLREHERHGRDASLGPYFGFVGAMRAGDDRRAGDLWVTTLEGVAGCGWRTFLKNVLKLEPPLDPFASLPDLDARLLGDVVHAVIADVADPPRPIDTETGTDDADDDTRREPRRIAWPANEQLARIVLKRSRAALEQRGILLAGFAELVAARVRPMVDVARELDRTDTAATGVVRCETERSLPLARGPAGARRLRFRIDRLDRVGDGDRATDYKTGRPLSEGKADTRAKWFRAAIARGSKLQASAYARAMGDAGSGRYVFLKEKTVEDARIFSVTASEAVPARLFDESLATLLAAWDGGTLFPRLLGKDTVQTNRSCAECEMAQACLRGDSAANRRLADFVKNPPGDMGPLATATRLWALAHVEVPEDRPVPKVPKSKSSKAASSEADAGSAPPKKKSSPKSKGPTAEGDAS